MEMTSSMQPFCSDSPVYYHNGKITRHIPAGLRVPNDKPCIIEITNSEDIITGLGTYYGKGYVLTALHVLEDLESDSDVTVTFPTDEGSLKYKAEFTKYCKTYPDRDQAFLKLLGDTDPLGDGLHNQIGRVSEINNAYFYTKADGHLKRQKCGVILLSSVNPQIYAGKLLLTKLGRPGDSGSAVFCNGKWVGIYCGVTCIDGIPTDLGLGTELDPEMNLWASPANHLHYT